MTDPQTAADAAERVQAFLDAWDTTEYLAEMTEVAGPFDGVPALTTYDLRTLLADRTRMAAELEQVRAAKAADVSDYDAALLAIHEARDYWQEQTVAEWERAEQLRDAVTVAAELIDRLVDDGDCDIDHNGYCQGHALHEAPCPHPLGRRFVEAWRAAQDPTAEKGPQSNAPGLPLKIPRTPDAESLSEAPRGLPEGAPVDTEPAPGDLPGTEHH